jgi:hypothetical protein
MHATRTPRRHQHPRPPRGAPFADDRALWAILASNLLTLIVASWQDWGLLHLLWPFWMQSVVIGKYARRRMLALQRFSTDGMRINDQPVEATPQTQRWTANFFALHFGLFHLVYLGFLLGFTFGADAAGFIEVTMEDTGAVRQVFIGRVGALDMLVMVGLGLVFWRSHRLSHQEHLAADLARVPKLGTLMMLPYARVLPMHLCILLGVLVPSGAALWLFGLLKTGADVLMHKVEHAWLAQATGRP